MGLEAHADPGRRYTARLAADVCYLLLGLFGATVTTLFAALPAALVMVIAGLALLLTLGNGLADALHEPRHREAALVTVLVTTSGIDLAGIGSAFWGRGGGLLVLAMRHHRHG